MIYKLTPIILALLIFLYPVKASAFGFFKNLTIKRIPAGSYTEQFHKAKESLDRIMDSYQSRNLSRMMGNVSYYYTGDKSDLEYSIRNRFTTAAFIEMEYYVDKVLFNYDEDKVLITVTYIKRTMLRNNSDIVIERGVSDLIFIKEDNKFLLWDMRPNIFN